MQEIKVELSSHSLHWTSKDYLVHTTYSKLIQMWPQKRLWLIVQIALYIIFSRTFISDIQRHISFWKGMIKVCYKFLLIRFQKIIKQIASQYLIPFEERTSKRLWFIGRIVLSYIIFSRTFVSDIQRHISISKGLIKVCYKFLLIWFQKIIRQITSQHLIPFEESQNF